MAVNLTMNMTVLDLEKFELCKKQGFVHLDWEEGISELSGEYRHYATLAGKKIVAIVSVVHIVLNPTTGRTKYQIRINFNSKTDFGDLCCHIDNYTILDKNFALIYAQWQVTLIFRLIEENIEKYLETKQ